MRVPERRGRGVPILRVALSMVLAGAVFASGLGLAAGRLDSGNGSAPWLGSIHNPSSNLRPPKGGAPSLADMTPPLARGNAPTSPEVSFAHRALASGPRVAATVVLFNNSVIPGNYLAGNGADPDGAAYDSATGQVFVCNFASNSVSVISDVLEQVVATVRVGTYPAADAFDAATGEIFVANLYSANVSVIDGTTKTVVATIPVGFTPTAVAYDPRVGEVFVANSGSNNVSVISDVSDKVVASIPTGPDPDALTFGAAPQEVFVANYDSDNVSVISDGNRSVVASVPVGSHPEALGFE
ncbi:MAG: hypothetical protein L3K02_09745, partial [Thermoplasmata archaeon]|nr:hypothetical protein [Thermoplasmata archaeon]